MIWLWRAIDWTFTGVVILLMALMGLYLYALDRAGVVLRTGL